MMLCVCVAFAIQIGDWERVCTDGNRENVPLPIRPMDLWCPLSPRLPVLGNGLGTKPKIHHYVLVLMTNKGGKEEGTNEVLC